MDQHRRIVGLINWISHTSFEANELLVPVSGGSDSALNFWFCCQTFGKKIGIGGGKVVGVHAGKNLRAREWFESVGPIKYVETPGEYAEREEMRWARFLAMSLERRSWLVGSRNRTEDMLGTYSLASRLATYLPLVNVWKTEVMELCRLIGVPTEILESSSRADPDCGRPPELAEISPGKIELFLGFTVGEIKQEVLNDLLSAKEISYLASLIKRNSFKRILPIRGIGF